MDIVTTSTDAGSFGVDGAPPALERRGAPPVNSPKEILPAEELALRGISNAAEAEEFLSSVHRLTAPPDESEAQSRLFHDLGKYAAEYDKAMPRIPLTSKTGAAGPLTAALESTAARRRGSEFSETASALRAIVQLLHRLDQGIKEVNRNLLSIQISMDEKF